MRSTPPQPSNYLGDDPDVAAELGQRLAATAQTGQGLITNYLFYGQRRAAEQQLTDRDARADERGRESSEQAARADDGRSLEKAVQAARHDLERSPHVATPAIESTVTDQQAETTRLTFRLVDPQHTAGQAGAMRRSEDLNVQ